MKMIINDCYGGFGVRQEVLDELELNDFSEEELRTAARLIEEIENEYIHNKEKRYSYGTVAS